MRFEGKVVVLTGASAGMGQATALKFAQEGATVIAVARRANRLEELAAKAQEAGYPGKIIPYPGDVSLKEVNEGMLDKAIEVGGKVDILVNNAGIMDGMVPVAEVEDERWNQVMDVNVYGPMCAIRKAVQIFLEQPEKGVIVNIASVGGLNGGRAGAAYTASKWAMIGLSKNTAFMYGDEGIRCNAICPGGVATEIAGSMGQVSKFGYGKMSRGNALMSKMGTSEEIADVVLFLASDQSSLINGVALEADGGWTSY
jgi:NAD(P)-dependent dehydrogenase (short-subunit alcohol dehydrogenase family)